MTVSGLDNRKIWRQTRELGIGDISHTPPPKLRRRKPFSGHRCFVLCFGVAHRGDSGVLRLACRGLKRHPKDRLFHREMHPIRLPADMGKVRPSASFLRSLANPACVGPEPSLWYPCCQHDGSALPTGARTDRILERRERGSAKQNCGSRPELARQVYLAGSLLCGGPLAVGRILLALVRFWPAPRTSRLPLFRPDKQRRFHGTPRSFAQCLLRLLFANNIRSFSCRGDGWYHLGLDL